MALVIELGLTNVEQKVHAQTKAIAAIDYLKFLKKF